MLRNALSLIFTFLLFSLNTFSQPLAAYVNLQNEIMVWNKGLIHKIDYLTPTAMKTGRTAIPYLDNSRSFKIYYENGVKTVNSGFTNDFYVSDNLVLFINAKSINVFDRGNIKNLCTYSSQYYMGDSIVLFYDDNRSEYKAYYNGNIYPVEAFMASTPLDGLKVSDNIAAYNNYAKQFRIFYQGAVISQEDYSASAYDVGRNTVAYVDVNRQFKIFHNGQTFITEDFPPASFQAGDNLAAYVSTDGYFKIFYGDSIRTVGYFSPEYKVGDNIVAYKDPSGYFKVFYKGNIYSLETYYPSKYTIQYNSVAYENQANTLRMFSDGEIYDVTNSDLTSWELNYDVIKYQVGQNMYRIFYKGQEYSED